MKKLLYILTLIVLSIAAKELYSQQIPVTQQISINATVISHSIVVSKRDLDFGNDIVPGVPKSINKTSEKSGMFSIEGKPKKSIKVSFMLPEELISGSNSMNISFSSTDAGYVTDGNMKTFDPRKGIGTKLSSSGTMQIFLGGSITPSVNQASGFYTAPIIINLIYTAD